MTAPVIPDAAVQALEGFWRPISEADRTITFEETFDLGEGKKMTIRNSDHYWVRDADGRIFEAIWSDHKQGYWWDIEAESPVDPVQYMPHPLSNTALLAALSHMQGVTVKGLEQILRDLITEQSEGEWDEKIIEKDVRVFAERIRSALTAAPSPDVRREALEEAARNLIAVRYDTYKARNGRLCSIEGDDGEKAWIVPFDAMADLESALSAKPAPSGWRDIASAPSTGFFLAWSPDFPEIPAVWKAEIFHQACKPGTPKHLSANHWTHWMPLPSAPEGGE